MRNGFIIGSNFPRSRGVLGFVARGVAGRWRRGRGRRCAWVVLVRAVDGGGPVSGLACWIWIRGFIPLVGWLSVGPGQARCRSLLSCRLALACFAGAFGILFSCSPPAAGGFDRTLRFGVHCLHEDCRARRATPNSSG